MYQYKFFFGILVADALYGENAALFCNIYIMAASTLMYSIGIALLAIVLVFSGIKLPSILQDSTDLIGSLTLPLAMMLVGVIVANEIFSNAVCEWRLYPYIFIRQLFASALAYLVFKQLLTDPILLGIFAVMFAMSVGSKASMFCVNYG